MTTHVNSSGEPADGPPDPPERPADRGPVTGGTATGGPVAGGTAARGTATRDALLAAAREVFVREGYARAAVTDIVASAGASVGSLYHHFPGKAQLYVALYDELLAAHTQRVRAAVRAARDSGVTDPMQLFLAGARAYLDVSIEQRDLAQVFTSGDGPPGFDGVWQQRLLEWVSRNAAFFERSGEPQRDAVAIVVTGAMILAVTEVCRATDTARARQIADDVISVLSRVSATA